MAPFTAPDGSTGTTTRPQSITDPLTQGWKRASSAEATPGSTRSSPATSPSTAARIDPRYSTSTPRALARGGRVTQPQLTSGEPLRADPKGPVQPRPVALEGDRARELHELRVVEMLAHAGEQIVRDLGRRGAQRRGVLEHQPLARVKLRAVAVPVALEQRGAEVDAPLAAGDLRRLRGAQVLEPLVHLVRVFEGQLHRRGAAQELRVVAERHERRHHGAEALARIALGRAHLGAALALGRRGDPGACRGVGARASASASCG